MSREIRRVPKGWEHPRNEKGQYIAMFDEDYDSAAEEWTLSFSLWAKGEHKDQLKDSGAGKKYKHYWDWAGEPPDKESYRPRFVDPADHFQIYETVSEGTPISPVFENKTEIISWLVGKGYSEIAAKKFAEYEYAPTMMAIPGRGLVMNIHALDDSVKEEK